MKNEELNLPCKECCKLDLSCCSNPQILFTLEEIDEIFTHNEKAMEGKTFFKGEIPGMVYILNRPPKDVSTIVLDYCAFYDTEKKNCSIYDQRPNICKTYGDPKYNSCPYDEYREPGALAKLKETDPELAETLHGTANNNTELYIKDFVTPFVERMKKSEKDNPEYMEFWNSLPTPNFIRNQSLKDSYVSNLKELEELKELKGD